MNKIATSQEEILAASRKIILEKGVASFSMRQTAAAVGVAVGSLYNYFPSKADLLSATIGSIWEEIFQPLARLSSVDDFTKFISEMFDAIKKGEEKYPGFFSLHSLDFAADDKEKEKAAMNQYFERLKARMVSVLEKDPNVRAGAFQQELSKEVFAEYVFTLLIALLVQKKEDCQALLQMISQCIY